MKATHPTFVGEKKTSSVYCDILNIGPYKLVVELDSRTVFPPSETTLALADLLLRYKCGSVLDVGTGSGLLAMVTARTGIKKVVALDINQAAIEAAKNNCRLNDITNVDFRQADITNGASIGQFELIVTNPPFMPMPERQKFVSEEITTAVHGGREGVDKQILFAKNIRNYLTEDGILLFPVPEFGDFRQIVKCLEELYDLKLIYRKPIRYWLGEYDSLYYDHVRDLYTKGLNSLHFVDGFVLSDLNIFECKPKKS